uniref:hypothetical protein n=1 Tax=Flavobacterium anhuiense TaxID=459526 RepID=UPI001FCD1E21|nr:hypothetical protein [Flavobacterium anhuiense]
MKRIILIARNIVKPIISRGKTSEVDELCTYIRHKTNYIWLVYALEKNSLKPFDLGLQRTILIKIFLFAKLIIIKRLPNEIYFIQIILKTVRELSR